MVSHLRSQHLNGDKPGADGRGTSYERAIRRELPGCLTAAYEPMTAETHALRREALAVFARGLAACYAGNLAEAERIFRQTAGVDPAAQAYADRCRELAAAPTTDAWTGVWVMTSKQPSPSLGRPGGSCLSRTRRSRCTAPWTHARSSSR